LTERWQHANRGSWKERYCEFCHKQLPYAPYPPVEVNPLQDIFRATMEELVGLERILYLCIIISILLVACLALWGIPTVFSTTTDVLYRSLVVAGPIGAIALLFCCCLNGVPKHIVRLIRPREQPPDPVA